MITVISVVLWIVYLVSLYFAVFWFLVYLDGDLYRSEKRKKVTTFPFVTIVIPAWNEEKSIVPTIESALDLDYPTTCFEVIIVNDGSTDKTSSLIKKTLKNYKNYNTYFIDKTKNEGKGKGLNDALKMSKGDYFICLDADSFIDNKALKEMVPHFKTKDIAAVLPCMKVKDPKNFLQKVQWYEYIINMFYKKLMSHLNCVHVAPGPFSMYRKEVIVKLGGFDENNLTEDLEITLRLQKNHYKIIQLLNVYAYTITPSNFKSLYNQRNRWFKGSIINAYNYKTMLFNKKYGDFGLMQLPTVLISGLLSIVMVSTIIYYFFKPKVEFIRNLFIIDFDFWVFLENLKYSFNILDLNYAAIFTTILMFSLSIFILIKSHKYMSEKVFKHGFLALITFLFFYYIFMGVVWIGIIIDLVRGRVQKW